MQLNRRELLRAAGIGIAGISASGWLPALAQAAAGDPSRKRHCILLWMSGGPTQMDTFDLKPGHANGGEFQPIDTSVPGLQISEHLPKLAAQAENLTIIRSLSTKEGDHGRGTYLMRTGHQPGGPISYPTMGSSISKSLGSMDAELPNYVSIGAFEAFNRAAFGPGFLGPRYAPLTVAGTNRFQPQQQQQQEGFAELGVDDLQNRGVDRAQEDARLELWQTLQTGFLKSHHAPSPIAHNTVYQRAVRMMRSDAAKAFDLAEEKDEVREAYGRGRFGQGCLMARRLVERGVPFVEVTLGGWDTHQQNFDRVKNLSAELDAGWATLMTELKDRGLLEQTTILWLGEFGRTPRINGNSGRDHFPAAWSCVLAGGGLQGGAAYGKTSEDGMTVEDGKVDVGDVLATLCRGIGVDPDEQNISELGRPIRIAEGTPIEEVLA